MADEKKKRSPPVVGGVLQRVSPSSIESFRRCPRRWYFQDVQGLEEPGTPAQELGEQVHKRIEQYLRGEGQTLCEIARPAKLRGLIPDPDPRLNLEGWGDLPLLDLPRGMVMRIDVIDPRELPERVVVIDWKTKSDISRYGKSEAELRSDIQMVSYARYALTKYNAPLAIVRHVNMQTSKTKKANSVQVDLSLEQTQSTWLTVEHTAKAMQAAAAKKSPDEVETCAHVDPDDRESPCHSFGRKCPFVSKCSATAEGKFAMNIAERLRKNREAAAAGTAAPAAPVAAPVEPPTPEVVLTQPAHQSLSTNAFPAGITVPEANAIMQAQHRAGKPLGAAEMQAALDAFRAAQAAPLVPLTDPATQAAVLPPDAPALPADLPRVDAPSVPEAVSVQSGQPAESDKPKRTRKPKAVAVDTMSTPPTQDALPAAKAPPERIELIIPDPQTTVIYVDCVASGVMVRSLMRYVQDLCDTVVGAGEAAVADKGIKIPDIRCADGTPLGFGKWKGYLAAAVRESPPPVGQYFLARSELTEPVIEALEALASQGKDIVLVRPMR